jgi:hypothetical protein
MNGCVAHPQGPTDDAGRCFSCWWVRTQGLSGGLSKGGLAFGGHAVRGYGLSGFGLGASMGTAPTTDANLLAAAQALGAETITNPCPASDPTTLGFQNAWNASTDTVTTGGVVLATDGKYGPDTAQALGAALGGNVQAACTSYQGGGSPAPSPTPPPSPTPAPCNAGYVNDSVTGQCVTPCSGGGAPANGVCPPAPGPSPAPSSSSSSSTGVIAAVVIVGALGATATAVAIHRKKKRRAA